MRSFYFSGKTIVLGSFVDTDAIIPARFLGISSEDELGKYFMADLEPELAASITPGSILLAGRNFGCGSSREHAPLAIRGAGISCIIAESFSRIFYRNAINIGLPVMECKNVKELSSASSVSVDCLMGTVTDNDTGRIYRCHPLPEFILKLQSDGGLIGSLEKRRKQT